VGIRSLKTGEVILYSYDGALEAESARSLGTDSALSFAESMGFLMDEDELGAGSGEPDRALVLGLWGELMGGGSPTVAASSPTPAETRAEAPADPVADDLAFLDDDSFDEVPDGADELVLLDEVGGLDAETGQQPAPSPESFEDAEDTLTGVDPPDCDADSFGSAESAPNRGNASELFDFPEPRPQAKDPWAIDEDEDCELEFADGPPARHPPQTPSVPLSKFRGAGARDADESTGGATVSGSGKALGRLKLVKRRGAAKDEQRLFLLRLLSSY